MTATVAIQSLKTKQDYDFAVKRLENIYNAPEGTPESDEANIIATLIEVYEELHFPIELPHPIEAIKIRMDELGLKNKDLVPIIGYDSRVSEVLNGKRKLTLDMIRALNKKLHIPLEVLVQDY
jgi:HTH-type transcriptional regulator / antitoxin HigA